MTKALPVPKTVLPSLQRCRQMDSVKCAYLLALAFRVCAFRFWCNAACKVTGCGGQDLAGHPGCGAPAAWPALPRAGLPPHLLPSQLARGTSGQLHRSGWRRQWASVPALPGAVYYLLVGVVYTPLCNVYCSSFCGLSRPKET